MLECSGSVHKRRTKKKKKEEHENVNVDMISHLPDPLLHHIFSFVDTKQTIQTCILSRRWRYFWVSLPTLNFNYYSRPGTGAGADYPKTNAPNKISHFMDFVDRVLLLHDNNSNIQKLSLVIKKPYNMTYRLNTWILTSVLRKNIQELTLRIVPATGFWEFPHCLGNCKSLTKLVFSLNRYTRIILPGSFTLPSLKSLSIEAVQFTKENSIENDGFVSERCFPVLETLILIDVRFLLDSLNISSLKLKHLKLESCERYSVNIHLDSPNLISFYYQGPIFKHWIIEKNLSSLVKADINVTGAWPTAMDSADKIPYAQQTAYILRELHNVEELTLSLDSLIKISREALELFDNHSMLLLKLKCLKLECTVLSLELFDVIACLLDASPNIETLCLRVQCGRRYCKEENSSSANQGDCWGAGLSLKCLKIFEFRNVNACVNELKFIEILLNEAVVLEKLFIVFGFGKSSSEDKKCRIKFKEKVLTFPRVSSRAAILFK